MIVHRPLPTMVSDALPGGTKCRYHRGMVELFATPGHCSDSDVAGGVLRLAAILGAVVAPGQLTHFDLEVPTSARRAYFPLIGLRAWPKCCCNSLRRDLRLWNSGVDRLRLEVSVEVERGRRGELVLDASAQLTALVDSLPSEADHAAFPIAAERCATAAAEVFAAHPDWTCALGLRSIGFTLACGREDT